MTNDRTYLRMMPTSELIITAAERYATDLELVLLERLETLADADTQLDDAKNEIDDLQAKWTRWMDEAISLHEQLDALRGTK